MFFSRMLELSKYVGFLHSGVSHSHFLKLACLAVAREKSARGIGDLGDRVCTGKEGGNGEGRQKERESE